MRSTTETGQVRFEFKGVNELSSQRYSYRFGVSLRSLDTGSAKMSELAAKVTHIIRRDTIKLNGGVDDRPFWAKMFDGMDYVPPKPKAKTRQIEVRAEARPSAKEIKQIIEQFSVDERKRGDWNNVGFATDKDEIIWVDKYRLHETVNFNKVSSSVFPAADMHARLASKRGSILAELIADVKPAKRTA